MSLVVATEPTSLVAVTDQCAAIETWAERCESVPEIQDAANKLAAIDEYLARTTIEGRGRVAAAMRRLEARIGELLPERVNHGPATRNHDDGFHRQQESDFRQMAAHPELVEQVIAESDDYHPASRRKVTRAIADAVAKVKRRNEDDDAIRQLNEELQPEGFDSTANAEQVRQRGAFARLCSDLAAFPDPAEFIASHNGFLRDSHIRQAEAAYAWLDSFLLEWSSE